jgi:hypothetical protein
VQAAVQLIKVGHTVFCPMLDYLYAILMPPDELKPSDFYRNSLEMMKVCEVVLVLPNHKDSIGTQKEIFHAEELGIPVVYSMSELEQLANGRKKKVPGELVINVHEVHRDSGIANSFSRVVWDQRSFDDYWPECVVE